MCYFDLFTEERSYLLSQSIKTAQETSVHKINSALMNMQQNLANW